MTKTLRAVVAFPYNGEFRNPGDKFPAASDSDADLLSRLGKVEVVRQKGDQPPQQSAPAPAPEKMETTAVKAEETIASDEEKPATRRERVYRRRDMRPEE